VALGIIVGFVLVTILHFATVLKKISFSFYIRDYVKGAIIMTISAYLGYWLFEHILLGEHLVVRVLSAASGMSLAYIILLIIGGLVKKDDLKRIPIIRNLIPV
jgi:stage V sporulation protein B